MRPNRHWVPIVILLLAFFLRLINLNTRPVWYDEAFAIFLAEQDFGAIVSGTAADTMPPFYYAVLHTWIPLFGETPFALRMLSVALALLAVALVYVIATRGFSSQVGMWAAFFTALAPFQIYYAQLAYVYETFAVGVLIYLYAVIRLRGHTHEIGWLVAISTAFALYSHNLAILMFIAPNIFFVWRREWKIELRLFAAQAVGGLIFVPWLFYVPAQLEKIQHAFWTLPPTIVDVLQMLTLFTVYLPLPNLVLYFALFVSLAVCVIATIESVRWYRQGAPQMLGMLVLLVLVPPTLMFVLSYVMRPIFVARGAIASSFAYYVVLAALAARAPRLGQITIGVIAMIIAFGALPFLYSDWGEWRRAPFAEADGFLRAHASSGDLILHDNKLSFFPMRYYDRTLPQEFLADPLGSANDTLAHGSQQAMELFPIDFEGAVQGHPHVWFVIFQTAIDQANAEGHPHGNLSRLDAIMNRGKVESFGDLRIILYESQ